MMPALLLRRRVVTVSTTEALVITEIPNLSKTTRGTGLLSLLPASLLAFIWPGFSAKWGKATVGQAFAVAAINTLLAFGWIYLIALAAAVWLMPVAPGQQPLSPWEYSSFQKAGTLLHARWVDQWKFVGNVDRIASIGSSAIGLILAYVVPFFMLLPLAARPGNNRACMRHVLKTILFGSGLIHWWGLAFFLVLFAFATGNRATIHQDYGVAISPLLFTFAGLTVWHFIILAHAARREYRTPADMPQSHDPWCDVCGYNLTGIDPAGRCPECGKPIEESLGTSIRPPTAWEQWPSVFNVRAIARQIAAIVHHPRRFFYSMPTFTGQRAAQRWLWLSLAAIFIAAIPILPAIYIIQDSDWNFAVIPGSLATCLVWTGFGLMMVGIETGGIAVFSRMRGHPGGGVQLAASAKVTCYTAILMVVWVLLGGTQLIAQIYYTSPGHNLFNIYHISFRWTQIILGVSLAIAHVGGLLWYELTVYRGIRAIQYAAR